jgi:hypothetical protein
VAFVPVAGVAIAASAWVMDLSHRQAPRPAWDVTGWLLNVLPSLVIGFLGYLALGRWVSPPTQDRGSRGAHLRRSAALYVVVIALGVLLLHDGGSPDFWSFGQLVLWPWVTAIAGILADGLTTIRQRRRGAGAA